MASSLHRKAANRSTALTDPSAMTSEYSGPLKTCPPSIQRMETAWSRIPVAPWTQVAVPPTQGTVCPTQSAWSSDLLSSPTVCCLSLHHVATFRIPKTTDPTHLQ